MAGMLGKAHVLVVLHHEYFEASIGPFHPQLGRTCHITLNPPTSAATAK
jgi:hypothetical protein